MRLLLIILTGLMLGLSGPRLRIETKWFKLTIGALILLALSFASPLRCHAAPLDAEQVRIVKQIEQRADTAEAALAKEHADHLAAEAANAESQRQVKTLGDVAAAATARADAAEKARDIADRAKWHARELLALVLLGAVVFISAIGRQLETLLRTGEMAAVHAVLKIPGVLKFALKFAPLLAFL